MMMNRLTSRAVVLMPATAALVLALAYGTSAFAQKAASTEALTGDGYTHVPFAGQTVAIDRQTGKLRPPTPEEARKLADGLKNFLNRSDQGLTIVTHPNGTQSVDLQGRFQSVALARINRDGRASEKCVTNMREAREFLTAAPARRKPLASRPARKNADRSAGEE